MGVHQLPVYMQRNHLGAVVASVGKDNQDLIIFVPLAVVEAIYRQRIENPLTVADIRLEQAALLKDFDPDKAIKACEAALGELPGDWTATTTKALSLVQQEQYASALDTLDQLNASQLTDTQRAFVFAMRGLCQVHLGQWQAAADSINMSITLDPTSRDLKVLCSYVADQITRVAHGRAALAEHVAPARNDHPKHLIAFCEAVILDALSITKAGPLIYTRQQYLCGGIVWLSAALAVAMLEMVLIGHAHPFHAIFSAFGFIVCLAVSCVGTHWCCRLLGGKGAFLDSLVVYLWTMGLALMLSAWMVTGGLVIGWFLALMLCIVQLRRSHEISPGKALLAALAPALLSVALVVGSIVLIALLVSRHADWLVIDRTPLCGSCGC